MELEGKSNEQLRRMLNKNSGLSASQVRSVLREMKKRGLETPPAGLVTGDRPRKNAIEMVKGGMANGKVHMYVAGGDVKDNAGLRALKASGPKGMEAYKKITGRNA